MSVTSGKLRVLLLAGTRPELIKIAPVIAQLNLRRDRFETFLCVTGQHRQMMDQVLQDFEIRPYRDLAVMTERQTLPALTAVLSSGVDRLLDEIRPDILLVQGDTTSAMVGALIAFYRGVTVCHIEAGLRTNNRYSPFPEEINRRLITSLASWHYAPTARAVAALVREGIDPDTILMTGNTGIDALHHMVKLTSGQSGNGHQPGRTVLVTAHRRESIGEPLASLCRAILTLVRRNPDVRFVYPVHLNPAVRETVFGLLQGYPGIELRDPVSYRDLVILLQQCTLVLTDSGGIQEEAPVLGKPVLVLRAVTERPEAVEAGTVTVVGTDTDLIVRSVQSLLDDPVLYARMSRRISPYGDGHASERIANHLAALTLPLRAFTGAAQPV